MVKKRRIHKYYFDYTLDLHGYTLEDAIYELERIMYSGKYRSILVVHGLGLGILKRGVRDYVRNNNFVRNICFGEDMNLPGGDGVTLIEI
jgi:dsDNA-specific endonuclease/ATPase MutS2